LVESSPVSQAMRAVVAADFRNSTSAVLDFRKWTFINADLTVNFRGSRSARGSCSAQNPGSVPMVRALRRPGLLTNTVISAAPPKVL